MYTEKNISALHNIIRDLTEIDSRLNEYIDTTMWISDPHGAGDRFVSILKGRFGLVWRICYEALPKTFSKEKIYYLGRIIRKERYFEDDVYRLDRQDIISSLIRIIQYRVQNVRDFDEIRININKDLKHVLENLILNYPVPDIIYENELIADKIISSLCKIVKQVILGHLIVLGDVFDRGDEPDKIIRILNQKDIKRYLTFIWGNHDILWMGASAGNQSLIAEALRITTRYDNLAFLERIGINIDKLKNFALSTYTGEITGNFKAKQDVSRRMEKALSIIQFKLEEQTIHNNPEFNMESRLWLNKLAEMLKNNNTDGLTDTHFPTIDLNDPTKLSPEEEDIINDLSYQFAISKKIRYLMEFLFEHGKLYHIHNYILNIHALIPSTEDGDFEEFSGYKGKELLDYLQHRIKTIGKNYLEGKLQDPGDLALMFYLWCGSKSPFFGKNAMKTFERYYLVDKTTHKEKLLYWGENLLKNEFMDKIMHEFGVERIVYGHTPVDIRKGEKIASPDGRAINIDGGFSDAYLNRGHALIQTPYSLYAIILPTPEEIIHARQKKEPVNLQVETIDNFETPLQVKDTYTGKLLIKQRNELYNKLLEYTDHYLLATDNDKKAFYSLV
ncbi:MAG TPA: fructose-bisphosphatase class III [Spirochaetota bacterium]|nr:fructose-bisphosphatase class III [Spirochaetota bacterium]